MADKKISQLSSATTPLAGTEVLPIVQSGATVKVSVSDLTASRSVSASGLTLSGGTANGVLYLDGGKVATSGTAVQFNGTNLGVGLTAPSARVHANAADGAYLFAASGTSKGFRVMTDANATSIQGVDQTLTGSYQPLAFGGLDLRLQSNGTTERWRVDSGGDFVQRTASKGVNFTANTPAAGMTSQLLNWYEEGTWTPTVTSSSGTITTITGNVGRYTRTGRLISCVCQFTITDNGTGAGFLYITGFPFKGNQTVMTYYPVYGYDRNGISLTGEYNPGAGGNGRILLAKYDATYPGATGKTILVNVVYEV